MKITEIQAPQNGGTCFFVRATDSTGERFYFNLTPEGKPMGIFREQKNKFAAAADMKVWKQINPTGLCARKLAHEALKVLFAAGFAVSNPAAGM